MLEDHTEKDEDKMTNKDQGDLYYNAGSTKPKEVTLAVARKLAEVKLCPNCYLCTVKH